MAPSKLNFKIYQGSTFAETLRWESSTITYVPITNVLRTAPMVVSAPGHGCPPNWRVKISGATGMKEVNTSEYITTTSVTSDTLTFNAINALNYTAYISGGVLSYNTPVPLDGYTARMQIREKVTSTTFIKELTTENGGIAIDTVNKTISLNISAADTSAFTFKSAVYSLELVNGDIVVPFIYGNITVEPEITR